MTKRKFIAVLGDLRIQFKRMVEKSFGHEAYTFIIGYKGHSLCSNQLDKTCDDYLMWEIGKDYKVCEDKYIKAVGKDYEDKRFKVINDHSFLNDNYQYTPLSKGITR